MALRNIDHVARTYDFVCPACQHIEAARPFTTLLEVQTPVGRVLGLYCLVCGALEGLNVQMAEQVAAGVRAGVSAEGVRQAHLVRELVRATS
jgi:hypothetical protein